MSKAGKSDLQGVLIFERTKVSELGHRKDWELSGDEDYDLWRFWVQGPDVPNHQGEWMKLEDFLDTIGHAVGAITGSIFVPRGS